MKRPADTCSRRTVLKFAASSALITMMSALSTGCGWGRPSLGSIAQRMIETLHHPAKAREIGNLYIVRTPGLRNQSFETITEQLLETLNLDPRNMPPEALNTLGVRLGAQVREDFRNEDVVILRGWMLSRTELLLCALAAIYT